MKKKILKITGLCFGGLLILMLVLYGYYKLCMDPYRGTVQEFVSSENLDEMLSGEEAKEDLEYLMERLRERHPAWLDGSGKDALVEAQYEKELASIGEEISVLELYKMASRIVTVLHDGHTYVDWRSEDGGLYVDDFTVFKTYGKPLSIDGIPCEKLLAAYKEVSSYETDFYAEAIFWGRVITYEPSLRLCGVDTSDGVVMCFDDGGKEVEQSFGIVALEEANGYDPGEGENKWVYYEIDKANNVGIFTLTACRCNDEYLGVLEDFFAEVFAEGIENVVVDLRGNGGGNSWVANEFMRYLDVEEYQSWDSAVRLGWYLLKNDDVAYENQKKEQVFDGELYVLTDTWTYSAAMDFCMLIADNDLGTVVGKPSGNLPDSYGDCLFFQLPNSGLKLSVSYKKWYRIDRSKAGQLIMPDEEVSAGSALEKVYELIKE
ncbi:MAG: S41 family peptidase [Lachnospiraceae bacterium]|nr:S41 family peptidase [Lachnospiraceae bacterium]